LQLGLLALQLRGRFTDAHASDRYCTFASRAIASLRLARHRTALVRFDFATITATIIAYANSGNGAIRLLRTVNPNAGFTGSLKADNLASTATQAA
jgi:hypothetical protein